MPDDVTLEALWRRFSGLEATVTAMQPNFTRLEHRIETCEADGQGAVRSLEGKIEVLSREAVNTTMQVVQVQRTVANMDLTLDTLTSQAAKFMAFLEHFTGLEKRLETTSDNTVKIMAILEATKDANTRKVLWRQVLVPVLIGAFFGACATIAGSYLQAWFALKLLPHG